MSFGGRFTALLLGVAAGVYLDHETSKQIWDANYRLSDTLHRAATGKPLPTIDVKASVVSPAARDVLPLETVDADKLIRQTKDDAIVRWNSGVRQLHALINQQLFDAPQQAQGQQPRANSSTGGAQ